MGKILEGLKEYYKSSSKDKLERNQKELEHLNNIGPDALKYIQKVKEYARINIKKD